jgi:phosphomannomutase
MLLLFDVDGTLTPPRLHIKEEMICFLNELKLDTDVKLGIVGGSDYPKIEEQMTPEILFLFDYVFSENGMVLHQKNLVVHEKYMKDNYNQSDLNIFIDNVLSYISKLVIPVKTGTFIEFRKGMINISPIGRNCSQKERDEFEEFDKKYGIRREMISFLQENFEQLNFDYSIGGQISFDVFPKNLNKTFCLNYLDTKEEIHFFGDKTYKGGNDYEIYNDSRVIGHSVNSYLDTIDICKEILHEV